MPALKNALTGRSDVSLNVCGELSGDAQAAPLGNPIKKNPMPDPHTSSDSDNEILTTFVRHRNVLLAHGSFTGLYVDYYLHLAEHGLKHAEAHDRLFKETLAAFALHCASRPRNETIAWTLHFQEPFVNLFLGGDTADGTLTGRVFVDDVREMDSNRFYADVARPGRELQRSAVSFRGCGGFNALESFYAQSEQRPARCFDLGDEEFVIAFAHPDCDMAWFDALTAEALANLGESEVVVPMERRTFRWKCGCDQRRILAVLAPLMREDPEGLFGGVDELQVHCPRCAARHVVTRSIMEVFMRMGG